MAKRSLATTSVAPSLSAQLTLLGQRLRIARKRRNLSITTWAEQLQVSEPTVGRMERGDPKVQIGIYAAALALIGRASALPDLAAPEHDLEALAFDVAAAAERTIRPAGGRRRTRRYAGFAGSGEDDQSVPCAEC
ncbi:MAG: XRE family transcriptional regulator [Cupriavidus sp.]|nr:MAG: XRE family transcriptional regulator [Cupriavidus sp.]